LLLLFKFKVVSGVLPDCSCGTTTFGTYCKDANNKLSTLSNQSYEDQEECTNASTGAFKEETSIQNINNNEYVFFDNNNKILSATSSSSTVLAGYMFLSSSFTAIDTSNISPEDYKYFVNLYNGVQIIKVTSALEYSIVTNIGSHQAFKLNDDGIVYCVNSGSCQLKATADLNKVFFINGDNPKSVIYCKDDSSCDVKIDTEIADAPYFIFKMGTNDGLIDCSKETCNMYEVVPRDTRNTSGTYADEGYYLGYDFDSSGNGITESIIRCLSDFGCGVLYNDVTKPSSTEYYINSGSNKVTNPLIKAKSDAPYEEIVASPDAYYINGDTNNNTPLIYCNSATNCTAVEANESNFYLSYNNQIFLYLDNEWKELTPSVGYFVNGGANRYDKPLIYCDSTNGCGYENGETGGYYIFQYLSSNSLIHCTTEYSCSIAYIEADEGYYINNQNDKQEKPLIECSDASCLPTELTTLGTGYFLDQSTYSNNKYYGLIYCESLNSCNTVDVIPGYYIDTGSSDNNIIECQVSCVSKSSKSCLGVTEKTIFQSGTYCYDDDDNLNFVFKSFELNDTRTQLDENEKSSYLINVSSDEYNQANYIYTQVEGDTFPGIPYSINTLFKISKSSITQVIEDGIVAVNSNTKIRISNYSENFSLSSHVALYNCVSSTAICTIINLCSNQEYIYDSKNSKGFLCNGSSLTTITSPGYYLDGSRLVNHKTVYVLDCDSTGKCQSIQPKDVYMINAGFDNGTNKLIYCDSNHCETTTSTIGYYLAYGGMGVINCNSTRCIYQSINNFRYFINAGAVKTSKIIIRCYLNSCSIITPNIGYYITHTPNVLINCISRSQCSEENVNEGYYVSGYKGTLTTKYIVHCLNFGGNINCGLEATSPGAYVTNDSNILVDCNESECNPIVATNGIYRSATTATGTKIRRRRGLQKRSTIYNLINCDSENCRELTPAELALIPICTFNNNQCYINSDYASTSTATRTLGAGGFCTSYDRSKMYFATDTIIVETYVIGGSPSTFVTTTTDSNCIEVSRAYKSNYYTVGSNIYHLDDNRITQIVKIGYYFINIIENTLVSGNKIEDYNNANVKIFKCNGSSCTIIDKLKTISYIADINKKIIKYDPEVQEYSFAYSPDITCIYANNQCTPKYDLERREFCITYLGELALTTRDIKSRESGECYKSNDIENSIYGFSNYLYRMDQFSAVMIENTAYYIVTKSSNSTAEYKDYSLKPKSIVIYGCVGKNCNNYEPRENVYYYDSVRKSMYKLEDGVWKAPEKGGFAYISVNPKETYVYKFSIKSNEVLLEKKVSIGFYYTIDKEMYECFDDDCQPITDSGYVFTNNGEIYYCEYDSEELEETICKIQSCNVGEYYYIDKYYYKCDSGNKLNKMSSKNCVYSAKYVINFPTILSNDYPSKVRYAVDKIARNNNSTATVRKGRNYLPVVPAVYTNCTYNFEDKEASFDLLCVKNYVKFNQFKEPEICSVSNMGYVVCTDDSDNNKKCNPSLAIRSITISFSYILLVIITALSILLYL
jgi:hypothetical protein